MPPHVGVARTTEMGASIKAGAAYFAVVFAIGFFLGALRVSVVAPRLGATIGVMLELPLIIACSWMVSRRCIRRFQVPPDTSARLLMGAVAFALLIFVELGVSVIFFGQSIADHFAAYRSTSSAIGLSAQVVFAFLPAVDRKWSKALTEGHPRARVKDTGAR